MGSICQDTPSCSQKLHANLPLNCFILSTMDCADKSTEHSTSTACDNIVPLGVCTTWPEKEEKWCVYRLMVCFRTSTISTYLHWEVRSKDKLGWCHSRRVESGWEQDSAVMPFPGWLLTQVCWYGQLLWRGDGCFWEGWVNHFLGGCWLKYVDMVNCCGEVMVVSERNGLVMIGFRKVVMVLCLRKPQPS